MSRFWYLGASGIGSLSSEPEPSVSCWGFAVCTIPTGGILRLSAGVDSQTNVCPPFSKPKDSRRTKSSCAHLIAIAIASNLNSYADLSLLCSLHWGVQSSHMIHICFSLQMCSALLFDFCGSAFSLRPSVLCLYVHHGRLMWTCVFNVWKALFLARGQHCQVFNSGDNVRLEASQISPLCNDVVLQHVWVALKKWNGSLISDGSPTHSVSELDYQSSCCLFHMAECGLEFRSQRNGNSCHTVPIHHASQ